eukprot:scaffold8957_cov68-Phaeocystis_antarctica.AAC.6
MRSASPSSAGRDMMSPARWPAFVGRGKHGTRSNRYPTTVHAGHSSSSNCNSRSRAPWLEVLSPSLGQRAPCARARCRSCGPLLVGSVGVPGLHPKGCALTLRVEVKDICKS